MIHAPSLIRILAIFFGLAHYPLTFQAFSQVRPFELMMLEEDAPNLAEVISPEVLEEHLRASEKLRTGESLLVYNTESREWQEKTLLDILVGDPLTATWQSTLHQSERSLEALAGLFGNELHTRSINFGVIFTSIGMALISPVVAAAASAPWMFKKKTLPLALLFLSGAAVGTVGVLSFRSGMEQLHVHQEQEGFGLLSAEQ